MTKPRIISPGKTWLVTRRTTRRHHLLRPDRDRKSQQIYWYVTALVARELGIHVHVVQGLSNHLHEILTDTRGQLPRFNQERNRLYANAIKCHRGWSEEVFSRQGVSCVELTGPAAIVREMAYTISNCVTAGLVDSPEQWPGVTVNVDDIGRKVMRVDRPDVYFDPKNPRWPPSVEIEIRMPDALLAAYGSEDEAREVIRRAVDEYVAAARGAMKALGRVAMGAAKILRLPFTNRAQSREEPRKRNPQFAAGGNLEEAIRATERRRLFHQQYRFALDAFMRGIRDVIFPFGTWKMRWAFGVECHAPEM